MKAQLLTLLLVFLLCSIQVFTLKCYICQDENDTICKNTTKCPDDADNFCRTYIKDEQLSRTCEDNCVEDSDTQCCDSDLCVP